MNNSEQNVKFLGYCDKSSYRFRLRSRRRRAIEVSFSLSLLSNVAATEYSAPCFFLRRRHRRLRGRRGTAQSDKELWGSSPSVAQPIGCSIYVFHTASVSIVSSITLHWLQQLL